LYSNNKEFYDHGNFVSGFGLGLRIRNNNLIFNTVQIRFGIYPGPPSNSSLHYIDIDGERLLNPPGFDPEAPGISKYR
ncbi:MAG TPA: hypothetical protein DEQ09_10085, partial [Bacteroidales bacterium]|nr:hypothetical protein [Bacteroidales bacterium]